MPKELIPQSNLELNRFLLSYAQTENLRLQKELKMIYGLWTVRIYYKFTKNSLVLELSKFVSKILNFLYVNIMKRTNYSSNIFEENSLENLQQHSNIYEDLKQKKFNSIFILIGHEASLTGAPVVLLEFAKQIKKEHEVLFFLNKGGPMVDDYLKISKTKVLKNEELDLNEQNHFKEFLSFLDEKHIKYTILLNTVAQNFWVEFLDKNKISFSTWIHELNTSWSFWPKTFTRQIETSRSIITDSQLIKNQLEFKFGSKPNVKFVKNGDTFEIKSESKEIKNFLFIEKQKLILLAGTRSIRKGFDLLPKLGYEIDKSQMFKQGYKILWIGGSMNPELDMFVVDDIERLGLSGKIEIMDTVNNYVDYVNACDIFIHLSREDSAPQVIETAIRLEKPIVMFEGIGGLKVSDSNLRIKVSKYLDFENVIQNIRQVSNFKSKSIGLGIYTSWPEQSKQILYYLDADNEINHVTENNNEDNMLSLSREPKKKEEIVTITVVIPNYNHEKFITERIKTVVEQHVLPDEIIFLDDCSSDESLKIARKELQKVDISTSILTNSYNSGNVLSQWKKGIDESNSEWIWIAESDDSASLEFIKEAKLLIQEYNSDLVLFESKIIDQNSITIFENSSFNRIHVPTILNEVRNGGTKTFSMQKLKTQGFLIRNLIVNVSAMLCRKEFLQDAVEKAILKNPPNIVGDWSCYLELSDEMIVTYCNKSLNYFRKTNHGVRAIVDLNKEIINSRNFIIHNYNEMYSTEDKLRFRLENLRIENLFG